MPVTPDKTKALAAIQRGEDPKTVAERHGVAWPTFRVWMSRWRKKGAIQTMKAAATWEDISSLTPWDKNPRRNAAAIEQVRKSIERFGFSSPIIARQQDRVIIAGHTRHQAALSMGLDKVPVRFLDLDPAQARALALADNKLGEVAEWDDGMLAQVLAELEAESVDLDGLGWSDEELAALLETPDDEPAASPEPDTSSDDTIPDEVPAVTQPGDVITIGRHTLHCTDCVAFLKTLDDNSIDAIVTDPPYGMSPDGRARTWDEIAEMREAGESGPKGGFMGREWDAGVPGETWARECLRVLKPGGHLIAFASSRTVHKLACAIEEAGFQIRDMISWLQWQGFPKSHDISKAIDRLQGATRETVRVPAAWVRNPKSVRGGHGFEGGDRPYMKKARETGYHDTVSDKPVTEDAKRWHGWATALKPAQEPAVLARKPAEGTIAENVLKWGTGALNIDGCRYGYDDPSWPGPTTKPDDTDSSWPAGNPGVCYGKLDYNAGGTWEAHEAGRWPANVFACPKPSRGERDDGLEEATNDHPTVKPVKLMRWLVRLVTPPGATVLETFGGSGTTLIAAEREGVTCIATELEPKYCDIIRARLAHAVEGK